MRRACDGSVDGTGRLSQGSRQRFAQARRANLRQTLATLAASLKAVPGLRTYTIGLIVHPHYTVVDHWFLTIRQAGFLLNINAVGGITNAASTGSFSSREASTKVVENTLNWLRGRHSIQTGGSWTRVDIWLKNQQYVPTINFGVDSADPANGLFATANFTGASQTQLDNAKNLFVVLTGRVLSINGEQRLDEATNKYLHAAAGHHRQHRPCVQYERDVRHRL